MNTFTQSTRRVWAFSGTYRKPELKAKSKNVAASTRPRDQATSPPANWTRVADRIHAPRSRKRAVPRSRVVASDRRTTKRFLVTKNDRREHEPKKSVARSLGLESLVESVRLGQADAMDR